MADSRVVTDRTAAAHPPPRRALFPGAHEGPFGFCPVAVPTLSWDVSAIHITTSRALRGSKPSPAPSIPFGLQPVILSL